MLHGWRLEASLACRRQASHTSRPNCQEVIVARHGGATRSIAPGRMGNRHRAPEVLTKAAWLLSIQHARRADDRSGHRLCLPPQSLPLGR